MRMRALFIFGLALSISVVSPGQVQPSRSKLKSRLVDVRGAKKAIEKKLKDTRQRAQVVEEDLAKVDDRLDRVIEQLDQTTGRLDKAKQEQRQVAKELEEATVQLEASKKKVIARLKVMYMQGQESTAASLISSNSLTQLAERKFVFSRIAEIDRRLFSEYKILHDRVAAKKARADQLVLEVGKLIAEQKEQAATLKDIRRAKEVALNDLHKQQDKLQRMIASLDQEESQIEAKLSNYTSSLPPFVGKFSRPVNAPMGNRRFGMQMHPILHVMRMHNGIDFGAKYGAPIHAAASGVVISASYGRGFGNHVIIDHGGGVTTLYAHCSRMNVRAGQRVTRGQTIGAVGSTGLSTGPHLHWEVRINGRPVNPLGRL
jgi:murein DD-endopeptidase MepM/ murein hydrolase activator NlpD